MLMNSNIFITISYAQSLDGKIATAKGESKWISSNRTLKLAHGLRRDNEVIIVGIGTVLMDDPELTCRHVKGDSPARAVFDSRLRIPESSKIIQSAHSVPTIIFTAEHQNQDKRVQLENAGAEVIPLPLEGEHSLDIKKAVEILEGKGYSSLYVEGGSGMITSFIRARLVHRMVVVSAPIIMGSGISAIGNLGVERMSDVITFKKHSVRRVGTDLVWDLTF